MKKIRGKKRQLRAIEKRINEGTRVFPDTFYNEIYSLKLPASQTLIEALRPKDVDLIGLYLLNGATALLQLKPQKEYKIAVLLFPNNMWYSEIIVFEHAQVYRDFFTRQIETGFWCEEQTSQSLTYSHWTQRRFIENEREQLIICYIER